MIEGSGSGSTHRTDGSGSVKPKNIRLQIRIRITASGESDPGFSYWKIDKNPLISTFFLKSVSFLAFLDIIRILISYPDPQTESYQILDLLHWFIDNFAQILFPSNEVKPAEAEAALPPLKKQVTPFFYFLSELQVFCILKWLIGTFSWILSVPATNRYPVPCKSKQSSEHVESVHVTSRYACSCKMD